MPKRALNLILAISVAMCAALGGCGRASITFALGGGDNTLRETTVIDEGGPKIAQIDVTGLILDSPRPELLGEGRHPVDELVARLEEAASDREVRAVVLRINSPGGGVAATETMYNEVRRFRERTGKPVVTSMSEVAASGGYYLSLAGDESLAQATSITGSIGVIIPSINISEAMARWGVRSRSITSGANKDLASPLEPMRDEHYRVLQTMVDQFYAGFRERVVERREPRGMDMRRADELMDGRVFTGSEAVKVGLVDRVGGLRDAFERAKALADVKSARLVKYHTEGVKPRTPYASSRLPLEPAAAGGDINLIKLDAGSALLGFPFGGAAAYYLWMPNP